MHVSIKASIRKNLLQQRTSYSLMMDKAILCVNIATVKGTINIKKHKTILMLFLIGYKMQRT